MKKRIILTVPVYNEEDILEDSINKLNDYMTENIKENWKIVIANNASTDNTKKIIDKLARKYTHVKGLHLEQKGRGIALRRAWNTVDADVYAYCDCDLATDINQTRELIDGILEGNNIVIGNRYMKNADSKRTVKRLVLSLAYNLMIKSLFRTSRIGDAQCGFKAIDSKIKKEVLPKVKNTEFFFDTEMLLIAESKGYRIKQIPIRWEEQPGTKVKFLYTIKEYMLNLIKLKERCIRGRV